MLASDVEAEKDEALEKAAAVAEDSVSRAEVKKLEKEIKKKDARIKKLEDVKLTKGKYDVVVIFSTCTTLRKMPMLILLLSFCSSLPRDT